MVVVKQPHKFEISTSSGPLDHERREFEYKESKGRAVSSPF